MKVPTKVRSSQKKLITRIISGLAGSDYVQDVIADLDEESAERLKDNPEFVLSLRRFMIDGIKEYSTTNKFVNEEIDSGYMYPREYKGPKPIIEQIMRISNRFNLDPKKALEYIKNLPDFKSFVPKDALPWVGWFAFPRSVNLELIVYQISEIAKPIYSKIDHFRVHHRTAWFLDQVAKMQGDSDILVIAAQLGMYHRGRSSRRALEVFANNEFGLNSVIGCSIAITHPERFTRQEQLHMILPGDQFDYPTSPDRFSYVPILYLYKGDLHLDTSKCSAFYSIYGSASGFLPLE